MTKLLKLAEFEEINLVPKVQIRRSRVDAQFDPQRTILFELIL